VHRTLILTLTLVAGPALAGCGTAERTAYDPDEQLLTTTERRTAAAEGRDRGGGPNDGPTSHTWELVAEYECPENAERGTWRQPATAGVVCRRCTDSECMPKMVDMHRTTREATSAPGLTSPVPTAAAGREPEAPSGR